MKKLVYAAAAVALFVAISLTAAATGLGRPVVSSGSSSADRVTTAVSTRTAAVRTTGWTQQTSGTTGFLSGVSCVSAGRAWACGQNATILRTTDGGATWTKLASPQASGDEATAVEFVDANNGWVTGGANAILRSSNGGTTWSAQSFLGSLYPPHLLALAAVDATHAWIGGYYLTAGTSSDYHNVVLRTSDGATWNMAANLILQGGSYEGVTGVDFPNTSNGWAVTSHGEIARSNDGGSVWTPPIGYSGVAMLNDISFADSLNGWAVGETTLYDGLVMHTSDGGVNWYKQAANISGLTPLPEPRAIHAVSPSVAWAVCTDGYILHTTDAGATWSFERPTTQDLMAVCFTNVDTGWAVGRGGVILRHGDAYVPSADPSSSPAPSVTKPVLGKLSPAKGRVGTIVTLTGSNFGAKRGSGYVKFGAKKVTNYRSWTATKIKVKVPKGTAKGKVRVAVKTSAGTSGAKTFTRK